MKGASFLKFLFIVFVAFSSAASGQSKAELQRQRDEINKKIVDLSEPLISEEGKELVMAYYSESLDPDVRGYKNLIRMMMDDGLFKYLPKGDEQWVYFLKPFLKLTRKEKTKFKTKK